AIKINVHHRSSLLMGFRLTRNEALPTALNAGYFFFFCFHATYSITLSLSSLVSLSHSPTFTSTKSPPQIVISPRNRCPGGNMRSVRRMWSVYWLPIVVLLGTLKTNVSLDNSIFPHFSTTVTFRLIFSPPLLIYSNRLAWASCGESG